MRSATSHGVPNANGVKDAMGVPIAVMGTFQASESSICISDDCHVSFALSWTTHSSLDVSVACAFKQCKERFIIILMYKTKAHARNFPTHFCIESSKATKKLNLDGKCQGWCADHNHPWRAKCKWKDRCDACSECGGELCGRDSCEGCELFFLSDK